MKTYLGKASPTARKAMVSRIELLNSISKGCGRNERKKEEKRLFVEDCKECGSRKGKEENER